MKYKDPVTGELKSITIKSGDTLPIGTIIEFDGTEVPDGYEEVSYEETGSMGNIVVDDIICKNIIPNNAVSTTKNGITLTVNKDKSITLKGTATAQTIFSLTSSRVFSLKAGEYTLSTGIVLPTGVRLEVWYSSATNLMNILSGYSQYLFNIASDTTYSQFRSQLVINSGTTVDMTIKYMLEKGPVATNYAEHKDFGIEDTGWVNLDDYISYRKKGGLVELIGNGAIAWQITLAAFVETKIGTLPIGFRPSRNIYQELFIRSSSPNDEPIVRCYLNIKSDGSICIFNWGSEFVSSKIMFNTCFIVD